MHSLNFIKEFVLSMVLLFLSPLLRNIFQGILGSLKISLSWTGIMSKPIFITIDDVAMVVQPVDLSVCPQQSDSSLLTVSSIHKRPFALA